jgi:glucose-6-phosphate isomerase
MTARELWDRYRAWLVDLPDLGVRVDVSRMDLPSDYLKTMEPLAKRALDDMEALEGGAIANPDEDRMVGHYWLRAPELAPDDAIRGEITRTRERIRAFATSVADGTVRPARAERFRHLLVVGIGGSALGPQFVAEALGTADDVLTPHFLDNTDPDGIDRVLGRLREELDETLVVVISKSGTTPETRNGMLETAAAYRERTLDLGAHAVAITQEGSALDRHAESEGFLDRFPMWDWVGGRTSVTSAVGLLPAALQGIDVDGILEGAAAMDAATRTRRLHANPAVMLALAWYHAGNGRGQKDMVVLPYKDRLLLFSRYLQQLVMESLGKGTDLDGDDALQGIAVYGNKGSTDQHAYVQQLRDGVPNFFVTFVHVLRDRDTPGIEVDDGVTAGDYLHGFLLGTRNALRDNGRASLTLTVPDVSPQTIGKLIALYERTVGLYASMIRINAYHQPGVEAGKKAAASVLDLQRRVVAALRDRGDRGIGCDELAAVLQAPDEVETVFHVLEHLVHDARGSVHRTPGAGPFDAVYRWSRPR